MGTRRWLPVAWSAAAMIALLGAVLTSPITAARKSARTTSAVTAMVPLGQILGLAPGTPEPEAREHLRRLGQRTAVLAAGDRDGLTARELWEVDDATYACVIVGFEDQRLRLVRGFVRPHGGGLRYTEVGDPREARRLDGAVMEWDVVAPNGQPARRVIARGHDPFLAGSVSIHLLD